jgi:hypothetical protein
VNLVGFADGCMSLSAVQPGARNCKDATSRRATSAPHRAVENGFRGHDGAMAIGVHDVAGRDAHPEHIDLAPKSTACT